MLRDPGIEVRLLAEERSFFVLSSFQIDSGALTASCTMNSGDIFPGRKAAGM
jgi:hypothetical protein